MTAKNIDQVIEVLQSHVLSATYKESNQKWSESNGLYRWNKNPL